MTALAAPVAATHDVVLAAGGGGVAGIGVGGFFIALIFAFVCAKLAGNKGRSGLLWGILGFFFNIITLIVILVLPSSS